MTSFEIEPSSIAAKNIDEQVTSSQSKLTNHGRRRLNQYDLNTQKTSESDILTQSTTETTVSKVKDDARTKTHKDREDDDSLTILSEKEILVVKENAIRREEEGKDEIMIDTPIPAQVGFDADAHAIARAHLLQAYPYTILSLKYSSATNALEVQRNELIWAREKMRELDADQFSLGNLRFHQATMALPLEDPKRKTDLDEFSAREERASQHRHRLRTREKRSYQKMQQIAQRIKYLESKLLMEWERIKAKE